MPYLERTSFSAVSLAPASGGRLRRQLYEKGGPGVSLCQNPDRFPWSLGAPSHDAHYAGAKVTTRVPRR